MAASRSRQVLAIVSLVFSMRSPPISEIMGTMILPNGCLDSTIERRLSSGIEAENSSVRAESETSTTSPIAVEHS